ncbi:hypothetical protein ACHAWF_013033 [Thalassiosira exigua]
MTMSYHSREDLRRASQSRLFLRRWPLPSLLALALLVISLLSFDGIVVSAQETLDNNATTTSEGRTCPIVAVLPFTSKGKVSAMEFSVQVPFDHMAAALMAIDHFNAKDPSVVSELASSELASCDVEIPVIPGWTIADGGDFTTTAVAALLDAAEERPICGVVGPYRNKAMLGAAHVTGAMEAPLISYGAADSAKIGRVHLYPLTSKITADEYDRAEAVMDYIKNYRGRDYVTLLHTTDLVDGPLKVMDHAAKKYGVHLNTEAIKPPFSKTEGPFSVPNAMQRIKDSGYRTVIVALYTSSYWKHIEKYADAYGLIGADAGYFWMSYDTTELSKLTAKTDSAARQRLLNGAGTVRVLDGFAFKGEEDNFLRSWRANNSTFVRRLNEINPIQDTGEADPPGYYRADDDYFQTHFPSPASAYMYDSIIALGIGACRGAMLSQDRRRNQMIKYPNTGTTNAVFNGLVNVEFEGASGDVVMHNGELYNRDPKTIPFGMYNLRLEGDAPISDGTTTQNRGFQHVLTSYRKPGKDTWSLASEGEDFVFADGTTNEPMPLKTIEEEKKNIVWWVVIGFLCAGILCAVAVYFYIAHKRKQADSVWSVDTSELKFNSPPEMIGQGTFGLVLLAEYRGTQVAVKRVLPPQFGKDRSDSGSVNFFLASYLTDDETMETSQFDTASRDGDGDVEAGKRRSSAGTDSQGFVPRTYNDSQDTSGPRSGWDSKEWVGRKQKEKINKRLKKEFIMEMRQLSKLRHPCITTVMGAVIAKKQDPMLIMEFMDHGSLYDLLHNDTFLLEGDLVLPILRDIAQGLRFLHAATPQVIHGDLKAANVLVDSKFRAKVADFGLSQKQKLGATGTPYWMAPELLRREGPCTASSDVYSFGVILYEVYSRKEPYEGEPYKDVIRMIADPLVNKRPPLPPSCPPPVRLIMTNCLRGSPQFRPTAEELDKELKRLDVATVEPGKVIFSLQSKKEEKRAQELLYEFLPRHVADQLRNRQKVAPESRDLVTIFFSDIVGFTNISSELPAIKISDMLDRLYNRFDELSHKHDVFKVETIVSAISKPIVCLEY